MAAFLVVGCLLVAVGLTHSLSLAASQREQQQMLLKANVNRTDNRVYISVEVITAEPYAQCHGDVRFARIVRTLIRLNTSSTGGAEWSWRIPNSVPAGRWYATVTCVIHSLNHTESTSIFAERGTGPGPRKLLFAPKSFRSDTVNVEGGGSGAGVNGGLYPIGQCTWWVAQKRPDLPYFPGHSGDAKNWFESAKADGWPVGEQPAVGAVAVMQPEQDTAGASGHVAYVVAVEGSQILVSDADFQGHHPGYQHLLTWSGLKFIYRKPPPGTETVTTPQVPTVPTTTTMHTEELVPPPEHSVVQYSCPFASPTINHTVEPGDHWGIQFVTQGLTITGGEFYVAAQEEAQHPEHLATVGIYTDESMTTSLGATIVTMPIGGTGVMFRFPEPIAVQYEESLYFAITAHDRFTAYDIDQSAKVPSEPDGCFIGTIEGTSPPVFQETVIPESEARTFRNHHAVSGEGPNIGAEQTVKVFCKVYDPSIASVLPGGYWYQIASAPWRGNYYSPANSFLDGDPPGGPYEHTVDASVPECA